MVVYVLLEDNNVYAATSDLLTAVKREWNTIAQDTNQSLVEGLSKIRTDIMH